MSNYSETGGRGHIPCLQPIHHFDLAKFHHPSPKTLCYPSLLNVVQRERGRPQAAPPGSCRPPLGVWCEPGPCTRGFTLAGLVWVRPGEVHFSQDQCHPLSHIPAMFRQGQKALNPTKTKQSRVLPLNTWVYINKLFTVGARFKYRHEYFYIAAMKYALILRKIFF